MQKWNWLRKSGLNRLALAGLLLAMTAGAWANCGSCEADGTKTQAEKKECCGECKPPICFSAGISAETDPTAAGAEAAKKAKAGMKADCEPKAILVYDCLADEREAKEKMLGEVAKVFGSTKIYGCSSYAPITQDTNTGTVGVLAIAGDVMVATTKANLEGEDYMGCGKAIGSQLQALAADGHKDGEVHKAQDAAPMGHMMLLFGKCHVPNDDQLVKGVLEVLGERLPVIGGAASGKEWIYYDGKVEQGINVGVLLAGGFEVGMAMKGVESGEFQKESVIATSGRAIQASIGANADRAFFTFVTNCGGRRGMLEGAVDRELNAIQSSLQGIPLFGFYGSGEIGANDNNSPSRGDGYHLSACTFLRPAKKSECETSCERPAFGVRRDGSYYSRLEWASHTEKNCLYWAPNLIDDDIHRIGGTWGANTMGPANAVLSFFGEAQPIGSLRIYHNVGAIQSAIEELASEIVIYVSCDDNARWIGDEKADVGSIKWTKLIECKMEKKEYWSEYKLEQPVRAKYVRVELVKNFGTPPELPWTETNEIKFYPPEK